MTNSNDPLSIKQGADYSYGFSVVDENQVPIDISSGTVSGQIRAYSGGPLYATFSHISSDPVHGVGTMYLTGKQTKSIPATTNIPWKHDAFFLRSDGVSIPIVDTIDVLVSAAVTAT